MLTLALSLLGIAALVLAAAFVSVFRSLSAARIQNADTRILEANEISPLEIQVLKTGGARLERNGLQFSHFLYRKEAFALTVKDRAVAVYRNESCTVWAQVYKSSNLAQKRYYHIDLLSYLSDNSILLTSQDPADAHVGVPAVLRISDSSGGPLADRIKGHLASLDTLPAAQALTPAKTVSANLGLQKAEMEHHIISGQAVQAGPDTARLKFSTTLNYSLKALRIAFRGLQKRHKNLDTEEAILENTPEDSLAHSLVAYHYAEEIAERKGSGSILGKLGLLLVTLVATFFWLGQDSALSTTLIVIGVLLIHEAGHFLAMLALGYRDLNMFFIPFFGAAVTGKEGDKAAPWKRILVSFAGPLPGIFIGTGLWLYSALAGLNSELLDQAAALLVVINLFNLLPILPLDGGHIAHHSLFIRFPAAQCLLYLASAIAMAAFGFLFDLRILLYIGIGLALSLPALWRSSTIIRRVRESIGAQTETVDKDSLLELIFAEMQIPSFSKLPIAKRCQIAREAIKELKTPLPRLGALALSGALYASIPAFPLLGLFLLKGTCLPSPDALEEKLTELREPHNQAPPLADPLNAAASYKTAYDILDQSENPFYLATSKLHELQASNDPSQTLNLAKRLKSHARHRDFVQAMRHVDKGLALSYQPIEERAEDEASEFAYFDYDSSYPTIEYISSAIAIDAVTQFLDGKPSAGYHRIGHLLQLSAQVSQGATEAHATGALPINQAYETLRVASLTGSPASTADCKTLFQKLKAAETALDESIARKASLAQAQAIESIFMLEGPPSDEQGMQAFKQQLVLWYLPDSFLSFYFHSALRDLDYLEFERSVLPAINTLAQLPYQRSEDQSIDAAMWSLHKLGTSSVALELDSLQSEADIAKTKIRLAAVATLLYLNEQRKGSLPDSLEAFATLQHFDAWIVDTATGQPLVYQTEGATFTLRSELSYYGELYDPSEYDFDEYSDLGEEFYEALNADTRIYWKGHLSKYPKNAYDFNHYATN